jgi:type II secretory pathway component PulJ
MMAAVQRHPLPSAAHAGATLIELLAATAVAALVVAVALGVYAAVMGTLRRQQERRWGWRPAAAALAVMRRDLAAAALPRDSALDPFTLEWRAEDETRWPRLSLYTVASSPGVAGTPGVSLERIVYQVMPDPIARDLRERILVRTAQRLAGTAAAGPETSEALARRIVALDIRLQDGANWTNAWSGARLGRLPSVAGIHVAFRQGSVTNALDLQCSIPAGIRLRASSAAASVRKEAAPANPRSATR